MHWRAHVDRIGMVYSLDHLHPFRLDYYLGATLTRNAVHADIYVGFGLHCFTRKVRDARPPVEPYADTREVRDFCLERYEHSLRLPQIIRTLEERQCGFGKNDNYLTVDDSDSPVRYAVFFNMKRWPKRGPGALLLVIQSAYPLELTKPHPSLGRIRFNVLVGHALRGTRPKVPRR